MKVLLTVVFMLFASNVFADCVTNRLGKTVCSNGQSSVAVNPNTGTVATAQKFSYCWRIAGARDTLSRHQLFAQDSAVQEKLGARKVPYSNYKP